MGPEKPRCLVIFFVWHLSSPGPAFDRAFCTGQLHPDDGVLLLFYALNEFHIGTLSWDILLVTLFLMCVSPYHGIIFPLMRCDAGYGSVAASPAILYPKAFAAAGSFYVFFHRPL